MLYVILEIIKREVSATARTYIYDNGHVVNKGSWVFTVNCSGIISTCLKVAPVKAAPPHVATAVGVDFRASAGVAQEGVGGGDGVGEIPRPTVHVYAQNFAQKDAPSERNIQAQFDIFKKKIMHNIW